MKLIKTKLDGVYIIEPNVFGDSRGWFMESWSKATLLENYIDIDFVQDNHSFTLKKGTIRGIHYQLDPYAQTKLVRVIKGAVLDVAVDLRKGSPTYRQWVGVELSESNKRQLLIPKGYGHGFVTLTDNVEFIYKCDNYYTYEADRSIRYDDISINVDWGMIDPILSDKDKNAPSLEDSDCNFVYIK